MLSLTIKDLKQFMNKLLIGDTFDNMCLSEAYICTSCSYTIDGKLNTHFYNEDEHSSPASTLKTYSSSHTSNLLHQPSRSHTSDILHRHHAKSLI